MGVAVAGARNAPDVFGMRDQERLDVPGSRERPAGNGRWPASTTARPSDDADGCTGRRTLGRDCGHPGWTRNGPDNRTILHGSEVSFRKGIVIGNMRRTVSLDDTEVSQ